jgi:hypothetical protein
MDWGPLEACLPPSAWACQVHGRAVTCCCLLLLAAVVVVVVLFILLLLLLLALAAVVVWFPDLELYWGLHCGMRLESDSL